MKKKKTKSINKPKEKRSVKKTVSESDEFEAPPKSARKNEITTSSTAEYFSKNLQQVGFSSPTKAVLTTLKEALDNSLDACEENGILPNIKVKVAKIGTGTLKNTDQVLIRVEDNGPGISPEDVSKVFGEYLASSKFGRGRCSRGQQGIGISAATTWAMQTTATGAKVVTKVKGQKKAFSCTVDMDLKNNKGLVREKSFVEFSGEHGTRVEFILDGRIQVNGEAGILNYLKATALLNPHMKLEYDIPEVQETVVDRCTQVIPKVPEATSPHPHTMRLGEFISHARLFGHTKCSVWLKKAFSRVYDSTLEAFVTEGGLSPAILSKYTDSISDDDFKTLFAAVQKTKLQAPATQSVMAVGEEALALSIRRLGDIDYFAVLTRKPTICDFKPVQVEVAVARLKNRSGLDTESPIQVLRFANRVPLQFDKAGCAIVKAITTVGWKNYGLKQPKASLPLGPYILAVSVVSPFIRFKNASKETIDASDELVDELRKALMQAGQRLSRYLSREHKAGELEQKVQHIEQFGPVLIETIVRILGESEVRKEAAMNGLAKILQKDTKGLKSDLKEAESRLADYLEEKGGGRQALFAEQETEGSEIKPAPQENSKIDQKPDQKKRGKK